MLQLKPNCECCDCDLPNGSPKARICSYECTFCDQCVDNHFGGICPNCGGGFVRRPARPEHMLAKHPASTNRVFGSHDGCLAKRRPLPPSVFARTMKQCAVGPKTGMTMLLPALIALVAASPGIAASAPVRLGPSEKPIAVSVSAPVGSRIVYVSGTVADPADPSAPAGSVARYGDTETQARSIFNKIEAALAQQGMDRSDIVMMRVFLVAPPGLQRMDFPAMMRAYLERFGTADQPNKPARSALQVAGLADPGWLVEIEVTAAKADDR